MNSIRILVIASLISGSVGAEQTISKPLVESTTLAASSSKINMNFTNEDLAKIIEVYAKASGQKFVMDSAIHGKTTIILPDSVTLEEAFNQLSSALAINGYAISKQGDTMIVRSARNIQRDLIEVGSEVPHIKPERMYTWLYTAKFVTARSIRELNILSSRDGEYSVNERNNQIIFCDWVSNINRIAKILADVDKPADMKVTKLVELGKKEKLEQSLRNKQNLSVAAPMVPVPSTKKTEESNSGETTK